MKSILAVAVLVFLFGTSAATQAADPETSMLQFAQRKHSQGDPLITTFGIYGVRAGTAAHWDLAQYNDPQHGEAWATEFGAGYLLPTRVNVYIGGGFVAGYRRNGGEYFGAWYPEIGAVVLLTDGLGVSVSRKRYQKLYQQIEGVVMFGLVLTTK
ncbi:MAG: hypothetical protein HY273_13425 [Gammaproteobacteria bacterium]|nr:hypothetical protein [Gammaproteobacteria bacterium]